MSYEILIERSAQKSLAKIPKSEQSKIIQSIESLSDNPRPHGWKKTEWSRWLDNSNR
jgi:mRNA-degrading endonuclease RelE of RelBE toxin-antitoxin system